MTIQNVETQKTMPSFPIDCIEIKPKDLLEKRKNEFRKVFSKTYDETIVRTFLVNQDRLSPVCIRSNQSIRKIEQMIDVLHFTLFDFELMQNQMNNPLFAAMLSDVIAMLKSAQYTISQESVKPFATMKWFEDVFVMALFAAIRMINQILSTHQGDASCDEELRQIRASLQVALDEALHF